MFAVVFRLINSHIVLLQIHKRFAVDVVDSMLEPIGFVSKLAVVEFYCTKTGFKRKGYLLHFFFLPITHKVN